MTIQHQLVHKGIYNLSIEVFLRNTSVLITYQQKNKNNSIPNDK